MDISQPHGLARRLAVEYLLYAFHPSILRPLADTATADGKRRLSNPEYPAQKRPNLEEGMCNLLYRVVVGLTLEDQPIGLPSGSGSWQPLPLPHRKWVQSRNNRRGSPGSCLAAATLRPDAGRKGQRYGIRERGKTIDHTVPTRIYSVKVNMHVML